MKRFYLIRSNITDLEYYHKYKTLEEFENNCHDFYLLFPLWLIKNNYIDEVIIFRLTNKSRPNIEFDINGKKFKQVWVHNFIEIGKYPQPIISLWRGGFKEYDEVVKKIKVGFSMYLGTGKRVYPQFGGNYNIYLQEDLKDYNENYNNLPFYKISAPKVFHKRSEDCYSWDICWPCNNTQWKYKGQTEFIEILSKSKLLKKLRIIHCGNQPDKLKKLCEKNNITNIDFLGHIDRMDLSDILKKSRFGLCMSNREDGCPRVVTEILGTGTPLIISEKTRLLPFYKEGGVIEINSNNAEKQILHNIKNYKTIKNILYNRINTDLNFNSICKKNIDLWRKELRII